LKSASEAKKPEYFPPAQRICIPEKMPEKLFHRKIGKTSAEKTAEGMPGFRIRQRENQPRP